MEKDLTTLPHVFHSKYNTLNSTRVSLNNFWLFKPSYDLSHTAFFHSYSSLSSFKTNQELIKRIQAANQDKNKPNKSDFVMAF